MSVIAGQLTISGVTFTSETLFLHSTLSILKIIHLKRLILNAFDINNKIKIIPNSTTYAIIVKKSKLNWKTSMTMIRAHFWTKPNTKYELLSQRN